MIRVSCLGRWILYLWASCATNQNKVCVTLKPEIIAASYLYPQLCPCQPFTSWTSPTPSWWILRNQWRFTKLGLDVLWAESSNMAEYGFCSLLWLLCHCGRSLLGKPSSVGVPDTNFCCLSFFLTLPSSFIQGHFSSQCMLAALMCPESERGSEVAQSCPTLCDPMDCSPSGSSVHGTFQARVLKWGAISFSRRSSRPRGWTWSDWGALNGVYLLILAISCSMCYLVFYYHRYS